MARKATLLGASGLIGSSLLGFLLEDDYYDEVHVLARRSLNRQHPKLVEHLIDFADPAAYDVPIAGSETIFTAIGTTLKNVKGDRVAYKKIDFDIPVNAAKSAAKFGVFGFLLVSSVGAEAGNNNNFYLKLKGIVEETVSKEAIPQVTIFRPSFLIGKRAEKRFGESVAGFLMPLFSWIFFGGWRKFKPIQSTEVAKAMMAAAKASRKGISILHFDEITKLAGGYHTGSISGTTTTDL